MAFCWYVAHCMWMSMWIGVSLGIDVIQFICSKCLFSMVVDRSNRRFSIHLNGVQRLSMNKQHESGKVLATHTDAAQTHYLTMLDNCNCALLYNEWTKSSVYQRAKWSIACRHVCNENYKTLPFDSIGLVFLGIACSPFNPSINPKMSLHWRALFSLYSVSIFTSIGF